jgi:hypothetical protein
LPGALSSSNGIGNTVDAIDAGWEYDDSVPYTRAGPQMAMNPQTIQMIEQLKAQGFSVEKIKLSLEGVIRVKYESLGIPSLTLTAN